MTLPGPPTPLNLEWAKDVGLPVAGAIVGFFVSRWSFSKKDQKDFEQKNYENTLKLIEQHDAVYGAYVKAIKSYRDAPAADGCDFFEIATAGDRYLYQLNLMCAAILSDKVDPKLRDEMLLAKARSAAERTLPQHYTALREIADKHQFPYNGELRRTDYSAVFGVVERYGEGPDWGGCSS